MTYFLPIFAFVAGVAGWFRPEQTPRWLSVVVVMLLLATVVVEVIVKRKKEKDSRLLKREIGELSKKSNAKSKFEMSVNGTVVVEEGQLIPLAKKGDRLVFELQLRNIGNATATNIQAFLWAPKDLNIPTLGRHWRAHGIPKQPGHPNNPDIVEAFEYVFLSPASINAGNWLTMGNGRLESNIVGIIPFRLKVYAEDGLFQEWTFGVAG